MFGSLDEISFLYTVPDDLFRLGNSNSAKLDHVRATDVNTDERNGVSIVISNGKGISLFTEKGVEHFRNGWLWKIPSGTPIPSGLALYNNRGAHYMICPTQDMALDRYKQLLCNLALQCERVRKV